MLTSLAVFQWVSAIFPLNSAIDTAKAIADELGVTVDFLLGGDDTIMDKELLQKVRDIESFTEEERTKIYELIDMAISYHKAKKAYSKA